MGNINEEVIAAVIDLGSNSFRLQVSDVKDGIYKIIEEYKEVVRIGDGVYKTGKFSEKDVETILSTLKRMQKIMDKSKVTVWRIVGTAPFRDAENGNKVLKMVKDKLGLDIDIISGEEEARLTYLAATGYFNLADQKVLFVDIGGGSTELSYSDNGELVRSLSTELGCSRVTQKFVQKQKAKPEEISKMKEHIDKTLSSVILEEKPDKIIFTGGTVNSLAQVFIKRNNLSDSVVKYVDIIFLNHLIKELSAKNYEDRAKIQGLEADRADISLAAALIVQWLLKKYEKGGFFAFSGGLRNGVTIEMLNNMGIQLFFQSENNIDIRYTKLIETGKKYNFEETHALHVTYLAERLFKDLYKEMGLKTDDWKLLEAASILHDIGQHISYGEHHKHSYYLVKNTEMIGYSEHEKELVANITRYHRRNKPKSKHPNFSELLPSDQIKVTKLAAILRIADGLDRSHMSVVEDVHVKMEGKKIVLVIASNRDADMEIDGVNRKKDLLEDIMEKTVVFKVAK